jgi:hypothetical protein
MSGWMDVKMITQLLPRLTDNEYKLLLVIMEYYVTTNEKAEPELCNLYNIITSRTVESDEYILLEPNLRNRQ